ncbi:MAG: NINE protein [Sulfuricurvum sp.]|jgi:TM2 domain-containing membrane protein YozV
MNEQAIKGEHEKYCSECGALINAKAEICPQCGVRQMNTQTVSSEKSRISAALFAFFLGGFGAHKFYLGQTGQGIIYLLFFWTLIPALVAFVEFILLLSMSDEKFNQKYGIR